MMWIALMVLVAETTHEERNPLYQELRQKGVTLSADQKVPLPAPTMPDGLDAEAQQAVIRKLAGEEYDPAELVRRSVVTPYILKIDKVSSAEGADPARSVDVWFIAYGDLEEIATKEFLDEMNKREDRDWTPLSAEELASRKITIPEERKDREGYATLQFDLLDRVRLNVTARSIWSRTEESVLVATLLDSRFESQWRPLRREGGDFVAGEAQPYQGAGHYTKITQLREPKGALFVESHIIFNEPHGWFNGANLLRSKLPPVVQSQVREARREFYRAGKR